MKVCSIILALMFSLNLLAEESNKKFSLMAGIGGWFMVAGNVIGQGSYGISQKFSIDLYGGDGRIKGGYRESHDAFIGLGTSFFPWRGSNKPYMGLHKLFVSLSYSFHRIAQSWYDKDIGGPAGVFNWVEKSHGIEIGVGLRKKGSWYVFEFVPFSYFIPIIEDIEGDKKQDYKSARFLNIKFGVRF